MDLKLNPDVIHLDNKEEDVVVCCFNDDKNDLIYELRGEARKEFTNLISGHDVSSEFVETFKNLRFIKSSDPTNVAPGVLENQGIKVKVFEDLFSQELEAYGFTTLTVTNCSSYSDCS